MNISEQYEAGLWVPSYYGLKFTIAKKRTGQSKTSEMDTSFKVATLTEAQDECAKRNNRSY